MPDAERDATVTDRRLSDEELRKAFQSLGQTSHEEPAAADLDEVWRAVAGELPADERRALVDRMARDPALAESWRVARDLYREAAPGAASTPVRRSIPSWMAAAAVLLVAVGIGVALRVFAPPIDDTFRNGDRYVVNSLVQPGAALSRDAFRLRWTPGPTGSRYQLRVTTEDLKVLTTVSDLTTPEFVVTSDLLAAVTPGSQVFWQVDVTLPQGNTVSSPTFAVKVQ
jgi:hypothetical protein